MWQSTHEATFPGLTRNAVWAVWSDVDRWHEWDRARALAAWATRAQ